MDILGAPEAFAVGVHPRETILPVSWGMTCLVIGWSLDRVNVALFRFSEYPHPWVTSFPWENATSVSLTYLAVILLEGHAGGYLSPRAPGRSV
jgi:hypothetical protein